MTEAQACATHDRRRAAGAHAIANGGACCSGVRATAARANLALISAGVAFFGLMAVIPGMAALASLVGLFGDPAWIG